MESAFLLYLEKLGIGVELLICLMFILTVVSLVSSLAALRFARKLKVEAGYERLVHKVENLLLKHTQLKSKFDEEKNFTKEEVYFIKERLIALSEQVESDSILQQTFRDRERLKEEQLAKASKVADSDVEVVSEEEELLPKTSFFSGLKKTRDFFLKKLNTIFTSEDILTGKSFDDLEELLITSDIGVKTTQKLIGELREFVKSSPEKPESNKLKDVLKAKVQDILDVCKASAEIVAKKVDAKPFVILVVGVNGVGKTTTIGKLASRFSAQGLKVLLGAADTFRAAAVDQIEVWAERASVDLHCGIEGAKPSTVAYEALQRAQEGNYDVVIIDTAGRLHTKVNLMNELSSVLSVLEKLQPKAPHEILLVVDAATGQNALEQAKEFNQRAKLTGIVVTKLDGSPKGGIVVAICDELSVPVRYVGIGEGVEDLKPFNAQEFASALFSDEDSVHSFEPNLGKSQTRAVRKRAEAINS